MSTSYSTIGLAIYTYIDAIVVTGILPTGWARKANYPVKQLTGAQYPAFFVVPADDAEEDLDAISDYVKLSFWVYFVDTFQDASDNEDRLRQLADVVRTQVRKIRRNPALLHVSCADVDIKGVWGAQVEQGERFYRLQLDVHLQETLI